MGNGALNRIRTDVELAKAFSPTIGQCYLDAAKYVETLPQFSVIKFREVLELLCVWVAERSSRRLCSDALFGQLGELAEAGLLTFADAGRFHDIRRLANRGAHASRATDPGSGEKVPLEQRSDPQLDDARSARTMIVALLSSLHRNVLGSGVGEVRLEQIDEIGFAQMLYRAAESPAARDKYEAGLMLEAQAERFLAKCEHYFVDEETKAHAEFLRRQAAIHFHAADQIQPNRDARCKYAAWVLEGLIDADRGEDAKQNLGEMADGGHAESCLYFGEAIREQDPRRAIGYFERAIQLGNVRGYVGLGSIYSDESSVCADYAKALDAWEEGARNEDRDCLYSLGRAYCDGGRVPQDRERASRCLRQAASLGHRAAGSFHQMFFEGGIEAIQAKLKSVGDALIGVVQRYRASSREQARRLGIGRNDPCFCGSGKKFKKCCGLQA